MSYLKNTLNFASFSYDASTNTPALAKMKDGTIFEVATAGKVVGTVINGCALGADSYLLVGDKVVYKNGGHELLSPKIKNGTTINVGTGGLFSTFKDANDYISQRVYTGVILNLVSATVETSSIDVQNPCGGRLVIMGNGLTIDFSATANTNCTLSGNNIYIDNFKVKANHATQPALSIKGEVEYSNALTSTNTVVAQWGLAVPAGSLVAASRDAYGQATAGAISVSSFLGGTSGKSVLFSVNTNGGDFNCGHSSLLAVYGPVTTGGGNFFGGGCCNNLFISTITTGGGNFDCGFSSKNFFNGLVAIGAGLLHFGRGASNIWSAGATGTGGVNSGTGSHNNCNGQPMPAGTPASGTNTAAFSRVN